MMRGDTNLGRCATEIAPGKRCRRERSLYSRHCVEHKEPIPPRPNASAYLMALARTKDALRGLQPALNVIAGDVIDDIIAKEIDPLLEGSK